MMAEPERPGRIDWLASYPKSGNTWLRLMLNSYRRWPGKSHDINDDFVSSNASDRKYFDNYLAIGSADLTCDEILALRPGFYREIADRSPARVWMKVHDQQERLANGEWLFPVDATGIAIYLIRDPRDIAVSLAFHNNIGDMSRCVQDLCSPGYAVAGDGFRQLRQRLGDWSSHMRSWVDLAPVRPLVLRYEDMLDDPQGALRNVLAHARPGEPIDEDNLRRAVAENEFAKLQRQEQSHGFVERQPGQQRFFRSGAAGGWVDHLTAAQAEEICDCHCETMVRFGYAT